VDRFPFQARKQDFYLTVSRLVSYKKIPLIVRAFNTLGLPLVVIGSGPELDLVRRLAQPNIQVLGWQSDAVVKEYMAQAKAFVYAAYEDFGIAPVEAQACGTPVIAYGAGGTLETVKDVRTNGQAATGVLFPAQTEAALLEAIATFEQQGHLLSAEAIHSQALQFSASVFQQRYWQFVEASYDRFQPGRRR
jgi:glycosyltransferase involved in cell wall biosynthesis